MNVLLEAALRYADFGYSVFPLRPYEKRPQTAHGLHDATTDEEVINGWWQEYPKANIGINTNNLIVLDVDGEENEWLLEEETRGSSLSIGAIQKTPNGGLHYIFKQPPGRTWRNTAGKIAKKIDTRGFGGYIGVAPSCLEGGRYYHWIPGFELACSLQQLALPPEWLIQILDGLESRKNGYHVVDGFEGEIVKGRRNDFLTHFCGRLRRMGCSESVMDAAAQEKNRESCNPPLDQGEVSKISKSIARYEPDAIETVLAEGGFTCEPEEDDEHPDWPGRFPPALLEVPGFIGDYIRYNLSISYRPQPILALAASLALVGTIIGRKVVDSQNTHPNIYTLGIGVSGSGKESARSQTKQLMLSAGLSEYIGAESFGSHAGLVSAVEQQSPILFQIDEIGRYFQTYKSAARAPHLFSIPTVLMRMFSSVGTIYKGDAYADTKKVKEINWPHACVYGTTVPRSFYDSLTREQLTDGFVSRLLIFESDELKPKKRSRISRDDIPQNLIDFVQSWHQFKPEMAGNLSRINPKPNWIRVTEEADRCYEWLENLAEREEQKDAELGSMWTRTVEKARKLGLLRACSRKGPEIDCIDEEDASWGCQVAEYLTRRMAFQAHENIFESEKERDFHKFYNAIEARGSFGMARSQITLKFKRLRVRDRDEIIADLLESGQIIKQFVKTKGRQKQVFLAMKHAKIETWVDENDSNKNGAK